jgi:hypothetical protein
LRLFASRLGLFAAAGILAAGCKTADEPAVETVAAEDEPAFFCGDGGYLSTELYGAIEAQLDWGKNDLDCKGMPRPEGNGARLRFAGLAGDAQQPLAFIIGIPDLDRGTQSAEFNINVTLIQEGIARFFSTPDLNNCLADISSVEALDESGDRFSITGTLYCVSPIPEVNGSSSVSIPELRFSGLLDWNSS